MADWTTIADTIKKRIVDGTLAPGDRLPSGAEIATEWGVSHHAAHRAVDELQRLGLVVRQRRWGTVVADSKPGLAKRVALMVDRFAPAVNFPSAEMIHGITDGLGENVDLIVIDSRSDPAVEARRLGDLGDVDGLIVIPTAAPENTSVLQSVIDGGLPTVVLDRVPEGLRGDAVTTDNVAATCEAILALEAQGHRRIGFFSFHKLDFSSVLERHSAYVDAVAQVGLKDHAAYERWFSLDLDGDHHRLFQAVSDAIIALTHGSEPITALFCVQDVFAAAAIEVNVREGREIALATFNDWPAMMLRTPPDALRIVQRTYDLGLSAAQLLLARIGGERSEPRLVRVPAELIVPGAGRSQAPTPPLRPKQVTVQ